MNAPPSNETRAAPRHKGTARNAKPNANQTGHSSSKVARGLPRQVPLALAYRIAAEANQIEAELRDRECRCPGRAYVAHAWNLGTHKDGCRAGYAWLSVDDVRAILQALPRRKLGALSLAIGGAS